MMMHRTENKQKLLVAASQRYFGGTCPALAARSEAAIVGLATPILRELAGRLQAFERLTNQVSAELRTALTAAAENHASAEELLDRALASLEHLNEVAEAMMQRLDELPRV
jgi:isopentenyl diphosphate isomerase/L-lactate dehydrogenase-like FMN-dependent dehydrogenase